MASTPSEVADSDYHVDLKAGWRLRVVIPILHSGGFIVPMKVQQEGQTITATVDADFIGYETDYYAIKPRRDSGIKLSFITAEAVEEGRPLKRARPKLHQFDLPPNLRFVRLVYLIRLSKSDHNLVIVAAADQALLELATRTVTSNDSSCSSSENAACVSIPAGVAVIPEEKIRIDKRTEWRPAR